MDRIECTCDTCRSFCHHYPGAFLPEQLPIAAAAMGLTVQEFFSQWCVAMNYDYWDEDPDQEFKNYHCVWFVRPRMINEKPGETSWPMPGTCSLLTSDQRCSIHQVKPDECAAADHRRNKPSMDHRRQVVQAWDNPECQALVNRLLDEEERIVSQTD